MSKRIKTQKTRVVQNDKYLSGPEQSPYWDDYSAKRGANPDDKLSEHPQANPDMLLEGELALPSTPQLLMGEAIEHLQGRQREVYMLLMREGKTQEEAADILGIGRTAVQDYKRRAVKFITQYCQDAMARGRV